MSRSVDYLRNASLVAYLSAHELQDELDWEMFVEDIKEQIKSFAPSFTECDSWDGNETHIILENELAEIGIAEYCGLVSVSIRPKESEGYYDEYDKTGLAENFIERIKPKFEKLGNLTKVGTFSNGEAIFETNDKDNKHTYSSKEGLCEWMEQ